MELPESEQTIHLADYLDILIKHRWLISAALILSITVTMVFTWRLEPLYQATATMVIDKERNASPLTGEILDFENYSSQMLTFNTHFKLITSKPVLEKVVKSLKLDQIDTTIDKAVSPLADMIRQIRKNVRLLFKKKPNRSLPAMDRISALAAQLQGKINIQQVRETRLLKISVQDFDPILAADIANELANCYIEFDISNRVSSSRNTLSWLKSQLYDVEKKLEDAEQDFLSYQQQEKIFSITGKQGVITQKIQEFNDAYLKTRHKRLELDAKLSKLKQQINAEGDTISARSLIDNRLIDNLYQQLLDAELERNRLEKVYKTKHPKMIQINGKIDETRKKLEDEINKEIGTIDAQRSVLMTKEKSLEQTISDFEKDAFDTNRKELRYRILQRNVNTNQNLYDTLLSKIKETNVEDNLDTSNIRIVEKASIPMFPIKPRKQLNFLLSIVVGAMIGTGLAFLCEYMDRTIRTEDDVFKYLDLPVLSVIPKRDKTTKLPAGSGR